jgi:hypothetical protein
MVMLSFEDFIYMLCRHDGCRLDDWLSEKLLKFIKR